MAAVAYTSAEAKTLEALVNALAESATFQGVVSEASAAAAKAHIIETTGGDEYEQGTTNRAHACTSTDGAEVTISLPAPHGLVGQDEFPNDSVAERYIWRSGQAVVMVVMADTSTDTPPERHRRALNTAGAIAGEMRALIGTSGYWSNGTATVASVERGDKDWRGYSIIRLDVQWES